MTITTGRGRPATSKPARPTTRPYVHPQRDGARTDRGAANAGAYVDGANALQVGYADPVTAPPRRTRPEPTPGRDATGSAAPRAVPLPVALPRAPFLVVVVSVVVVGVLGVLVLNTKINENAFRLDALRQQQTTLDQQEQDLARQLALRESPGELRAAAARLGLVPAGTPAFINLPDGRVVGIPQPAPAGAAGTGR
jgi:hypothetical protein